MNSHLPFFSVVVPTYNRKAFLDKCIRSILDQSFVNFELIIVDDGSTDQTQDLVNSFNDERITYLKQDNHGVSHARNQGIRISQAPYIAFLDSDDWWHTNKLQVFSDAIKKMPEISIFHSKEEWFRSAKLLQQKNHHTNPDGRVYYDILDYCCISMSTAVVSRRLIDQVGLFDESFQACEDYDFWLRAAHAHKVHLIEQILTFKEGGRDDQLSALWGLDRYRVKALAKMLNSKQLNQEEYNHTLTVLKKKAAVYIKGALKRNKMDEAEYYQELVEQFV